MDSGVVAEVDPLGLHPVQAAQGRRPGGSIGGNATTPQSLYLGLNYVAKNPFVQDPIRPNTVDRVIAANMGFGSRHGTSVNVLFCDGAVRPFAFGRLGLALLLGVDDGVLADMP